ncbi:polysaccharide lyase family 14 protein [Roridomyces roridus]|uniref:Polysaccharide lyase family 14 protein n=1 Tax=Roridomyces roridus TaxID=1738132 RepID=A0AAD7FXY6_9AGAR|nr:polysaccharide lyase family 14 protein [Roridomyces roridus]
MSLSLSHHLFPVSSFSTAFTTCCFNLGPRSIDSAACPILHVPGIDSIALRNTDGPNGSINPAAAIPGGFGLYVAGPVAFSEKLATGSTHAVLSYRMLQEGWEWVKGGKLPGIWRGRLLVCMPKGQGELYTHLPSADQNQQQLSAVPPYSTGNAQYGFSVGRDAFNFDLSVGRWIALAFRVKLNDVGYENGVLGRRAFGHQRLGPHATFFGGHQVDWASPKDQRAWFADLSGAVIE